MSHRKKTTCFTKMPLVCVTALSSGSLLFVVLLLLALSLAPWSVLWVSQSVLLGPPPLLIFLILVMFLLELEAAFRLGSSFRVVSQAFLLSFDCCRDILGLALFCLRRLLSVLFILVLSVAPSSALSASFLVLFYAFFYQSLLLNGLVIVIIPYVSYLLTLLSGRRRHVSQPVAGWFHS